MNKQLSDEPSPLLQYIIDHKTSVLSGAIISIFLTVAVGLYISKHQYSLASSMASAEQIYSSFTANNQTPKENLENLKKMQNLSLTHPSIAARFSGIIAQEELIQHVRPLTPFNFEKATKQLTAEKLFLQSQLDQNTFIIAQEKPEEALKQLSALASSMIQTNAHTRLPKTYAYILLQQATLLKKLSQPNKDVITRLNNTLKQIEGTPGTSLIQQNLHECISFLQKDM